MKRFRERLNEANPDRSTWSERRWIFVPYDQLTDRLGPLSVHEPREVGIVMVETTAKGRRRRYHQQKLALLLTNQRHFALEQAQRGVAVDYRVSSDDYGEVLAQVAGERGGLIAMEPAERELRRSLRSGVDEGWMRFVRHEGWLSSAGDFADSQPKAPPYRMDRFYRAMRQKTGWLMDGDSPQGGRYSLDGENQEFWPGEPPAASPPTMEVDAITEEVVELVRQRFGDHPGAIDPPAIPATADDARAWWHWAREACMEHFGPYEDAMSVHSRTLFHTRISALLNLHRLLPVDVVADVAEMDIPLNSKEGMIRQVLGWREFVRHIHRVTDGFRQLPEGYEQWERDRTPAQSRLGADRGLPAAYWGKPSGLHCLDTVVTSVLEEGYSHHITRLMILCNIAMLLDVDPEALNEWFWVMYIDAYDWVVEPNVLGMGTFAVGDLMTTKPYVSGANYIDKMSDYCQDCAFDPKKNCPLREMYWAFLERHRAALEGNQRMALMLGMLKRRSQEKKARDRAIYRQGVRILGGADKWTPEDIEGVEESKK